MAHALREYGSSDEPASGEPSEPDIDLVVPLAVLSLAALVLTALGCLYCYFRRFPLIEEPPTSNVALLGQQVEGASLDFQAFAPSQVAPPLLAPRVATVAAARPSDTAMQTICADSSERSASVGEGGAAAMAELIEEEDGSGIPRALAVDLPNATAVDSRYAMYSLRELPIVTAEEIQEI